MDTKKIRYLLKFIPDKLYLKICYRIKTHKKLNLRNPRTFNEKLQWLKLYDRKPEYTMMVDKLKVRKYIEKKIGEEYLIPLIGGPWRSVNDINIDVLPKQFVLKCNHDSGSVVICKNRDDLDFDAVKRKLSNCLKHNFWFLGREWPYKDVVPCIIAEMYLIDDFGEELKDYKFMCFNGKVQCSFVCSERFSQGGLKCTFYDKEWNRLPFERHYPSSQNLISKPQNYNKMVELSEKLAEDLPFVRVDFYEVSGKIYFGELTFYPGSGFERFQPDKWDRKLGEWIKL